jgi:predicted dehydrogenase
MMFSRYEPGFFTAHQLVSEGAIGEIRLINARKSYKMGKRAEYYHSRTTYGGTIPWVGSHAIDWVLWFLGKRPRSVCAMHSRIGNGGHGEMESSALCQFLFDNDVAASISIDVLRPASAPTHGDDWMRLVGTKGVMEVRPTEIHLINDGNDGSRKVPAASDRTLVGDLIEEIRGGKKGLIDAAQTLELTEMCLRARDAADGKGKFEFESLRSN